MIKFHVSFLPVICRVMDILRPSPFVNQKSAIYSGDEPMRAPGMICVLQDGVELVESRQKHITCPMSVAPREVKRESAQDAG
jgi:hypothetical protein